MDQESGALPTAVYCPSIAELFYHPTTDKSPTFIHRKESSISKNYICYMYQFNMLIDVQFKQAS